MYDYLSIDSPSLATNYLQIYEQIQKFMNYTWIRHVCKHAFGFDTCWIWNDLDFTRDSITYCVIIFSDKKMVKQLM